MRSRLEPSQAGGRNGLKRAVLLVAMLVVALLGGSVSARADTTTALPITGLSAIVVDDAHQQVFLTGDAGDGVVLVTDTTGHVTKTFSGEVGAAGMVLSGGTLYVARCGTTSIDMIDAASLTKSGSFAVSQTIGAPCDLAKAGGRLWFNSSDHLVAVTLDAAHTVTGFDGAIGGVLSTASGAPQLLLANRGSFEYGGAVFLYDVSGQTPNLVSNSAGLTVAELVPDGASMLSVRQTQSMLYESPVPDLYPASSQYDFSPPGAPIIPSMAITADGAHFAASTAIGYDQTPSISLFEHVAGYPQEPYAVVPEPAPVLGMAFAADGSKLFVVEHGSNTTIRAITSPLRPGAIISIGQTFAELQVGDPFDYTATLSFSNGASPLGKTVALTLTDPDGNQTSLGSVTADADGSITMTLPDAFNRAGDWFLRASYPGDAAHQRTVTTKRIIVRRRTATLDIHTTPATPFAGTTATVGGILTLLGPDDVAGRDVAVYATPPGGSETLVATVPTDTTGAYAVDLPLGGGAWSFRAAYAGDVRYAPADSAHLDVSVSFQKPAVSLVAGRSVVTYGDRIALTATLGPTHTNRAVRIIRVAGDGSRSLLAQGQVDASGHLRVSTRPGRTVRFVAEFAGDDWFAPGSAAVRVQVRAAVTLAANNAYRSVGGVRLFRYHASCITTGRGCPRFTARVRPNHAGRYIDFVLSHRVGSHWVRAGSARFRLGRTSRRAVLLHYRDANIRTGLWRTRVHFLADADHLAATSAWLVFRVTL